MRDAPNEQHIFYSTFFWILSWESREVFVVCLFLYKRQAGGGRYIDGVNDYSVENRDKWEEDSNLHGLLLTIIKNKALNYLAHLQVRLRAEEEINSHSQRELDLRTLHWKPANRMRSLIRKYSISYRKHWNVCRTKAGRFLYWAVIKILRTKR